MLTDITLQIFGNMKEVKPTMELVDQTDQTKILNVSGEQGAEIKVHKIQIDGVLLMKSCILLFHISGANLTLHEGDHINPCGRISKSEIRD